MYPANELFKTFYRNSRKGQNPPRRTLCFDPGGTTGWAVFDKIDLLEVGQIPNLLDNGEYLHNFVLLKNPSVVVIENYKIYPQKTQQHTLVELFVPKLIGRIEQTCDMLQIPYVEQMASDAKGFANDARLESLGWMNDDHNWRHSVDAIRHGVYFLLFNNKNKGKDFDLT